MAGAVFNHSRQSPGSSRSDVCNILCRPSGHGSEEVSTLELHCLEKGAHSKLQRGRDHKQKQHFVRPVSGLGDISLKCLLLLFLLVFFKMFVSCSLDLFGYLVVVRFCPMVLIF